MKFRFWMVLILIALTIPSFVLADTCTALASCGTQTNWKTWGQCLTDGYYTCDDVRIVPGGSYALARAVSDSGVNKYFKYKLTSNTWTELSDPKTCLSLTSGVNFIGMDKTTSSSNPIILLYAKYSTRESGWPTYGGYFTGGGWPFEVVAFSPTESCSGCSCWTYSYGYKSSHNNVGDFAQNAVMSFACIKEGAGYNGVSGDVECWWGGKKGYPAYSSGVCSGTSSSCYQGFGIGSAIGWWNDPGAMTGNTPIGADYTVWANTKSYAISEYNVGTVNYAPQIYEVASTSGGGSYTYRTGTALYNYGSLNGAYYTDFGATSPVLFGGNKVLKYTSPYFGIGNAPGYINSPSAIVKGKRSSSNVIWALKGNDIQYMLQSGVGTAGWTTDSCFRPASGASQEYAPLSVESARIMDFDSTSNTGWVLPTYRTTGQGCVPVGYGSAGPGNPPPFGCTACGLWSTPVCGGSGTVKICTGSQQWQSKSCPNTCADPCEGDTAGCAVYTSGTQKIAERCVDAGTTCTGGEIAKCRSGGSYYGSTSYSGTSPSGISGSNWWVKSYVGSEPTQNIPCPSTDVGSYSIGYGSSFTITNRAFHYNNLPGKVTVRFTDKYTGVVVGSKVITMTSGTNAVGGKSANVLFSNAADYDALGLCGGRNYSVSTSVAFDIGSSGYNNYDWWSYQPWTLRVTGTGGAYCAYNTCQETSMSCYQGSCLDPTPRYYRRTCTNNFNETQITYGCKADATCSAEICVFNSTIQDCGSNGCGSTELPDVYNCVKGSSTYNKYTCNFNQACVSTCTAWESRGCGGNQCTFYNGIPTAAPTPPSTIPSTDYISAFVNNDPVTRYGSGTGLKFFYYYMLPRASDTIRIAIKNSTGTQVYTTSMSVTGVAGVLKNDQFDLTNSWGSWSSVAVGTYTADFYMGALAPANLRDTLTFNVTTQGVFYQDYQQRTCNTLPGDNVASAPQEQCLATPTCSGVCTLGTWQNRSCGEASTDGCTCTATQRLQVRTASPGGCGITCQCIADAVCVPPSAGAYRVEASLTPASPFKVFQAATLSYRVSSNYTDYNAFVVGFWENNVTQVVNYSGAYYSTVGSTWYRLGFDWPALRQYGTDYVIRISACLNGTSPCNSTEVIVNVTGISSLKFTGNATVSTPVTYPAVSGGAGSFVKGDPNLRFENYFVGQPGGSGTKNGLLSMTVCDIANSSLCMVYPDVTLNISAVSGVQTLYRAVPSWSFLQTGHSYNIDGIFYISSGEYYDYSYGFSINADPNYNVSLTLSPSSVASGDNLTFIVRPNSTESVNATVWFSFYTLANEHLDDTPSVSYPNGVYSYYDFTPFWTNYMWLTPGSQYKVCANARWTSSTTPSDCKILTVQVANYTIGFAASDTSVNYLGANGDYVSYSMTPIDMTCIGGICAASEVTLYYASHNVGLGGAITTCQSRDCGLVMKSYTDVASGVTNTFTLNAANWNAFNLEEGKYYGVFAIAKFPVGGQPVEIISPVSDLYIGARDFDQTGFAPIRVVLAPGLDEKLILYGNNANGPFICVASEDMTVNYCYNKAELEVDQLSGVTMVKGGLKGPLSRRDNNQLIYTGWSLSTEFSGIKLAKFGIIDPFDDGLLDLGIFTNAEIGSGSVTIRSMNPPDPSREGASCISNPIRLNCPGEVGLSAGICFDSGGCGQTSSISGGEFGFVYYVGQEARFDCVGADGLFRGNEMVVSNFADSLYSGSCKVRGGITAVDVDKDGYEEVIGGGGIISLTRKIVTYPFGEDRAIIPSDINGDGFSDFVSQAEGAFEAWMGTYRADSATNESQFSGNLSILGMTCVLDAQSARLDVNIAPVRTDTPNSIIYSFDPGDGVGPSFITHDNSIEPWLSNPNQRSHFSIQYTKPGTFVGTGKVSQTDGTFATMQCPASIVVNTVPAYYSFTGTYNGLCGMSSDGLFTSYSESVSSRNWASREGYDIKSSPNGIQLGTTQRYTLIHDVKAERDQYSFTIKLDADTTLSSDFTYTARKIGYEAQVDIVTVRVKNGQAYYIGSDGSENKILDLVAGRSYDVKVSMRYNSVTAKITGINIFGGVQGTMDVLSPTILPLSDTDVDVYNGKLKFSYLSGSGYLKIFDFYCDVNGTEVKAKIKEGEATQILRSAGIDPSEVVAGAECLVGEPDFWSGNLNNTPVLNSTGGQVYNSFGEPMYVHGKTVAAYPHIETICGYAKTGTCGYNELKAIIAKYPACYKEAHNYCIEVAFLNDPIYGVDQTDANSDGSLSCTTILMSSSFFDRAVKPTLKWLTDLIAINWFILGIIIVVVMIGASFTQNKRR